MKQSHNIALILAGGTGERMRASVPKQFMEIDGETVLLHTVKAFQQHPLIHEIYLVCMPEWESFVRNEAKKGFPVCAFSFSLFRPNSNMYESETPKLFTTLLPG